jgi:hypothetical protein
VEPTRRPKVNYIRRITVCHVLDRRALRSMIWRVHYVVHPSLPLRRLHEVQRNVCAEGQLRSCNPARHIQTHHLLASSGPGSSLIPTRPSPCLNHSMTGYLWENLSTVFLWSELSSDDMASSFHLPRGRQPAQYPAPYRLFNCEITRMVHKSVQKRPFCVT